MKLGDLLVAAGLIGTDHVSQALERQRATGERLGDALVGIGAITRAALDGFLFRVPVEPATIEATGIDPTVLMTHVLVLAQVQRLETVAQIAREIRLSQAVVADLVQMAVDRALVRVVGDRLGVTQYAVTEAGARAAQQALEQSAYVGPAPVSIEEFNELALRQRITNATVTPERVREAVAGLRVADGFVEKLGPALNSGRPVLMYGPPGNGKTSVARRFASIFDDLVFVPHAVMVGGQVMRVFDPNLHQPAAPRQDMAPRVESSIMRPEQPDGRWVLCRRPFVVAGGELTLEMLDLQYDPVAGFYEAPLHVKALGGCFVIDDFGRQLVAPTALLNRWIVPMENRIDFLKLRNGKTFTIPFEALLVFSTNLDPEDLMDPAFLRRLPYKIEVGAPSLDDYRAIFEDECKALGIVLRDELFDHVVRVVTEVKGMALANYHPKFIVDQVVATCRFLGEPPHLDERFIERAVDNLRVTRR